MGTYNYHDFYDESAGVDIPIEQVTKPKAPFTRGYRKYCHDMLSSTHSAMASRIVTAVLQITFFICLYPQITHRGISLFLYYTL